MIHAGDYVFPGIVMEFKNLNARLVKYLVIMMVKGVYFLRPFWR